MRPEPLDVKCKLAKGRYFHHTNLSGFVLNSQDDYLPAWKARNKTLRGELQPGLESLQTRHVEREKKGMHMARARR